MSIGHLSYPWPHSKFKASLGYMRKEGSYTTQHLSTCPSTLNKTVSGSDAITTATVTWDYISASTAIQT